jgi:peptidoglycan/LPS O-acetylase OafA/YrhL
MRADTRREVAAGTYIPALDGVRALAVVAVLFFHAGVPGANGGYLGVSLFFTLSGFLMGSLLLRERSGTGRIDYMRFWERRCRRLLPAALLTLGAVAILSPHLQTSARPGLRGDLLGALGYVANWRFIAADQSYASLFDAPNPVQHFWSLAIEEQFYVLFPLLVGALFFFGRGRRGVVVAVIGALAIASVASQFVVSDYDRAYYGTDTRAAELLAGVLLAGVFLRRPAGTIARSRRTDVLGTVGLAAFVALVVLTPAHPSWLVHGGFGAVAVVNVALIGGALAVTGPVAALLGARPLVAIGKISYGLYLYHWPVFLWLDGERTGWSGPRLLGARLAVTVVIAVVSYHLLECPIRYRRRLVHRPRLVGVLGATLAIAVAFAATAPQPVPPAADLLDERVFSEAADGMNAELTSNTGPPPLRVMVVGDETGHAIASGLAATPDLVVMDATRAGCPLLRATTVRRSTTDPPRDVTACAGAPSMWVAQAKLFRPDIILVLQSVQDVNVLVDDRPASLDGPTVVNWYRTLVDQYESIATELRSTGAVVAWGDLPLFTFADRPELRGTELLDQRVGVLNTVITETTARSLGTVTFQDAEHINRRDGSIDLNVRPDGVTLAPLYAQATASGWLAAELRDAYREGRAELGLPVADEETPSVPRVLVVGDSTSLAFATGLANHARGHRDMLVDWAGQVACPVIPARHFKMYDASVTDTNYCEPSTSFWAARAASFRPDMIVVFSSFMDAMDLDVPGVGWGHFGERAFDAAYAAHMDTVIESLAASGAVIVWADAPKPIAMQRGPMAKRLDTLNALIAAADARWAHVTVLPVAVHTEVPEIANDRFARPDGVHFTVEAATAMADQWLAADVLARADIAATDATSCRTTTGAAPVITLDACRVQP